MADHEFIRREVERLARSIRAELQTLAEEFRRRIEALVNNPGHPDVLQKKIDALGADYERRIAECEQRLRSELDRRFPATSLPKRGPFEEPSRRSPPSSRRRLPKWPPDRRPSAGGVTVEPNKPSGLSGGAAAPLETD